MSAWWLGLYGLPEELAESGTDVPGEGLLRLTIAGHEWELDSAEGDPVTLVGAGGMSIYADLDGDGRVDYISTVHAAGGFEVWSADAHVAEWGLPGLGETVETAPETSSSDAGGWGLPEVSTPEMGGVKGGIGHAQGEWHCVYRG